VQIEVRECLLSFGVGSFIFVLIFDYCLYGFLTWSMTLREERHTLRMFENGALW